MPRDAFSVIQIQSVQKKTALNFKHFESRREIMRCRFAVSDFMGLVGCWKVVVHFFPTFIFLSHSVRVAAAAADAFVVDRVCVCFYLVNFPTFRPSLATLSQHAREPYSLFYSRCLSL